MKALSEQVVLLISLILNKIAKIVAFLMTSFNKLSNVTNMFTDVLKATHFLWSQNCNLQTCPLIPNPPQKRTKGLYFLLHSNKDENVTTKIIAWLHHKVLIKTNNFYNSTLLITIR